MFHPIHWVEPTSNPEKWNPYRDVLKYANDSEYFYSFGERVTIGDLKQIEKEMIGDLDFLVVAKHNRNYFKFVCSNILLQIVLQIQNLKFEKPEIEAKAVNFEQFNILKMIK